MTRGEKLGKTGGLQMRMSLKSLGIRVAMVAIPVTLILWCPSGWWCRGHDDAVGSELAGQEQDLARRIDSILRGEFPGDEPGAAVIVQRGAETILRAGYGMADMELGVPVDPAMVFRMGSVTKQFTALAVMKLVEDGRISLEDPVREYIPNLPEVFDRAHIKHLLSNSSGIPDHMHTAEFDTLIQQQYHDIVNEELDLAKIFRIIAASDPAQDPGARYSYSNSNFFLLGMIIEKVSGEAYFDFVKREICDAAGMVNTFYAAGATFVPGRVPVHLEYEGQIIKNPHRCMGSTLGFGCGGLWSTVDDLARYNLALESGRLVTDKTLAMMCTPFTLSDGRSSRYGLGWQTQDLKGRKMVFHGGDYLGYSALILRIPSENIFIALLTNDSRTYAYNLDYPARKIAALLFDDPFPEWQTIEMPADALERYVGTYRISDSNAREFLIEDGQAFTQRNGGTKLEVFPASDTTFFYTVTLSYIEFELDQEGVPTAMVMHRDTGKDEVAVRVLE
jgi:CubicO group peptidase (beta-lactamase class C family)